MKQQTRVGKILESLNKRRRVFSEAWNIPNNLRDKKHIKTFLDNAQSAVRKYFGTLLNARIYQTILIIRLRK